MASKSTAEQNPSIPKTESTSPAGHSPTITSQKRSLQDDPDPPIKERKSRKAPHELLTDAEKKANHIASEQKRRQNIRLGFDQLIDIVPALNSGNRSEALILQKCKWEKNVGYLFLSDASSLGVAVDHIKQLITVKNDLKDQIRDLHALLGES